MINPILLFNIGLLLLAASQVISNWKAVKRTLTKIIDTLSKEKATTLIAGIGAIVYCGWVVYLVMGGGL